MVHHNSYERITCESHEDLFVMCRSCHVGFHSMCKLSEAPLACIDWESLLEFVQLNPEEEEPVPTDERGAPIGPHRCPACGKVAKDDGRIYCGATCERRLVARNERGF